MRIIDDLSRLRELPEEERAKWYIPEEISTSYPIEDCGERLLLVSARAEEDGVPIIVSPVSPENPKLYLRESALERLLKAARLIASATDEKATLKVTDAFRPLALQRRYFDEISADIAKKEGLSGKALWEKVTQFIADPDRTPPHSTGGAVDLTVATIADEKEFDMGTPVDAIDERANTWHEGVTGESRTNRDLLFRAMTAAGFVNLASEWWHYSYGDQYWAAWNGETSARYGSVETTPS